jgi:hypothetical protein
MRLEPLLLKRAGEGQIAPINVDHVRQRGDEVEINLESWLPKTQLYSAVLVKEPPMLLAIGLVRESQPHNTATGSKCSGFHAELEPPQE